MFTRRRGGRERGRALNLLSILALVLLIAIFLARRLKSSAPHLSLGASSSTNSGEKLTPADRQSLDRLIRDKAHH